MLLSHVTWATCQGWASGAKGHNFLDLWTSSRLWREGKHGHRHAQLTGLLQHNTVLWGPGGNESDLLTQSCLCCRGVGAMEIVAMDMKVCCSQRLSTLSQYSVHTALNCVAYGHVHV